LVAKKNRARRRKYVSTRASKGTELLAGAMVRSPHMFAVAVAIKMSSGSDFFKIVQNSYP
jgi:hypothetical protein